MDVREKWMKQAISHFWYGVSHDIFSEPVKTYAKLAIEALEKENGVTVQEHGYWVSLTDCANAGVYCSVCHKKVYKEDYAWCNKKNKLRSDYCPHCGAKMMPQPPKGE